MFLRELYIKNLATINEIKINFSPNLNLITGETGAGKSIIVDALKILSGEKVDLDLIRYGEDSLVVEGVFDGIRENLKNFLKEKELEGEKNFLILRREIYKEKPQRIYINDRPSSLKTLQEIGNSSISIFGQREGKTIEEEYHYLNLLDLFAEINLEKIIRAYDELKQIEKKLKDTLELKKKRDALRENLEFSIKEIEKENLKPNELEELLSQKFQLKKREEILKGLNYFLNFIEGEEKSTIRELKEVEKLLEPFRENIPFCEEILRHISKAKEGIEDAFSIVSKEFSHFQEASYSIDTIESRIARIENLQKKYGKTIEDILNYLEKAKFELSKIENLEEELKNLEREFKLLKDDYDKISKEYSNIRMEKAKIFKEKINKLLPKLNLKEAKFEIELNFNEEALSPYGKDKAIFKIQTNVGEAMLPLEKIASGGELARINLAIQEVIQAKKGKVLIFDEVDQGIGGRTAFSVGRLLKNIGKKDQVLCVSHLPQVAIWADNHIKISKTTEKDRTFTYVNYLKGEEKTREIARMLGGEEYKSALEHAKKLLESTGEME